MRRHDLLRIAPLAWQTMLDHHPGLEALPLVGDWASHAWPVIVRRRMAGDIIDGVPAALPLPPSHGKRRIGVCLASQAGVVKLPPVMLRDAAATAPRAWQPTITALLALGAEVGTAPRVFGALLWEHATRLAYVTRHSDLDLLWGVGNASAAAALLAGLRRLDGASPMRLDGELELPDGGGVNWRELAQTEGGPTDEVLVKSIDGVTARPAAGLFLAASESALTGWP
jgi:phosphoribosyl-dephospho-CoA transferase